MPPIPTITPTPSLRTLGSETNLELAPPSSTDPASPYSHEYDLERGGSCAMISRSSSSSSATLNDDIVVENTSPTASKGEPDKAGDVVETPPCTFDGPNDPADPRNWSKPYRWFLTALTASLMVSAVVGSSAPSGIQSESLEFFNTTPLAVTGLVSTYVAGFAIGPLVTGPASELYGRRPVLIMAFALFSAFNLGTALATHIEVMLVFRFLAGLAASTPLTIAGAVIAELWHTHERSLPMGVFSIAAFAGPIVGPIVSGYLGLYEPIQWVYWLVFFFSTVELALISLFLPETYEPLLMEQKAKRLRESGRLNAWAPLERTKQAGWKELRPTLLRPLIMLWSEPIVFFASTYVAVVYGLLYLLLVEYYLVFQGIHGFDAGTTGLMFLPLLLGGLICIFVLVPFFDKRSWRLVSLGKLTKGPENRLNATFVGGPCFVISLFWFGWTSREDISAAVPAAAGVLFGVGYLAVFYAFSIYLAETYREYSASALGANQVLRSILATIFPLFARQLINEIGVDWASTLFGGIALILLPFPWVFQRYGARLRARSPYSREEE